MVMVECTYDGNDGVCDGGCDGDGGVYGGDGGVYGGDDGMCNGDDGGSDGDHMPHVHTYRVHECHNSSFAVHCHL